MPLINIGTELAFFFHVPRCAGSAVENYLIARFGDLGFLNRAHETPPPQQRWSRSSPQHIDVEALDVVLPSSFYKYQFATVRHPVARLRSVFLFQRDWTKVISPRRLFSQWLEQIPEQHEKNPFIFDNHTRPMSHLVPQTATTFKLELGLDPVVAWLDSICGNTNAPRSIEKTNDIETLQSMSNPSLPRRAPEITQADVAFIADYYKSDFDRFGYSPDWNTSEPQTHQGSTA
ncbi:MAG: sulfotransferase family 2 domain-containing protein [Pseudoruegeria sp.]